ncbi:MAG: MBL fold metallo-hydrolase [Myxococcota bacterium]
MVIRALFLSLLVLPGGCVPARIFSRNFVGFFQSPLKLESRIRDPVRPEARLAVLWIGHATLLIQIDDKFILTDPVFTDTVGQFSRRLVEPGLAVEDLPPIDICLISHMHFDHLSYGSLEMLEDKIETLFIPEGGLVYVPEFGFTREQIALFNTYQQDGVRITPVPVRHSGWRYGADAAWMKKSHAAWVIEYHGIVVYFGGDSAYDRDNFEATRARFPRIELAILGIGPVEPYAHSRPNHMDGIEAVRAAEDLGARVLIPMHFDTFPHGLDEPGDPKERVLRAAEDASWPPERLQVLPIGGQAVLLPRERPIAGAAASAERR